MDALTALLMGGLGGLIGYCLAKGEPIPTEAQLLKQLESTKPKLIQTLTIDTSDARDNEAFPLAGQSLYVVNPTTPSNPVYIRLNEADAPLIELTGQRIIKAPFYRIFITNDAGSGKLSIVAIKVSTLELEEAVTDVNIAAQSIGTISVDIIAQSIGNIAIDIAAQSLGQLDVNIAAQTANINIDISAQTVTVDINVASQSTDIGIIIAASDIMVPVDIQAQYITVEVNVTKWGGAAVTGADITTYLARLNVNLSTIASQATLASILARLNVNLSTIASQATLASILAKLDVALSTRATEATLATKVNRATTPVIYNVAITDPNTEYSQALPANTKRFSIQTRDGTAFRVAFVTGKVAAPTEPYRTVPANTPYIEELVEPSALTLFFACAAGTKNAEIVAWS